MFAKTIVFFFALTAFVNAAPIVAFSADVGVLPLHPTVARPNSGAGVQAAVSKRGASSNEIGPVPSSSNEIGPDPSLDANSNNIGPAQDFNFDVDFDLVLPHNKRWLLSTKVLNALKAIPGVKVNKRDTVDLDAFGSKILNGLKSHGLNEYIDHFSTRIQRLKDLPSDVPPSHIAAEADNLLLEYRQVLAGLDVNKPVEARDIVVNPRVLAQLQTFVSSTVSLLRALGKSDAVDTFLSEVNDLKTEAQNGTLDVSDLLSAARDILSSLL